MSVSSYTALFAYLIVVQIYFKFVFFFVKHFVLVLMYLYFVCITCGPAVLQQATQVTSFVQDSKQLLSAATNKLFYFENR